MADERLQRDRHLRREGIRREQADPALPEALSDTRRRRSSNTTWPRGGRGVGTGPAAARRTPSAGQRRRGTVEELELAGPESAAGFEAGELDGAPAVPVGEAVPQRAARG